MSVKPVVSRVLLTPNLVLAIAAYQDGIYFDMRLFLSKLVIKRSPCASHPMYSTSGYYGRIMTNSSFPVVTSWLTTWGVGRLPKLFACLPCMHLIVAEHAAWSGNVELLETIHTTFGLPPQHERVLILLAIEKNHLHVLVFLRACGYKVGNHIETIASAIKPDNLPLVRFLHTTNERVFQEDIPRLFSAAVQSGDIGLVQYVLDQSDMLSALQQDASYVMIAAYGGHYDVTLALLALGFDATALTIDAAVSGDSLKLVQHLYDLGGYNCTISPMDAAAGQGHLDLLLWLHAHRNEGCTTRGFTFAVHGGHLEVVQFLHIQYPDTIDRAELSSFVATAAAKGHWPVVQYLLQHKLCDFSRGILDGIASSGQVHAAQWLVDNQETVGFKTTCTTEAMTHAASNGHLAMLQWLHQHHPAVGCTTQAGYNAISNGHVEVVQWLMAHGYFEGVAANAVVEAIGRGSFDGTTPLLQCPQDYMEAPNVAALGTAMKRAASLGHVGMIRWLVQSGTHVCACALARHIRNWLQDDLMDHWLRKKACGCANHG
ncbi:Aste57867_25377 [Aphanomyces stellatus]|uniref:Aste57867_25377 protein n=1 Tax=Aphanomyces stellatus TaxID=120398 RepID=A0A485LT33_9STRA|nr:hypothetical protein As57867_025298 [Aphanomyces stellatus]VFU02002.1 Aste57867_25377 [Aphanomyces stellatus]